MSSVRELHTRGKQMGVKCGYLHIGLSDGDGGGVCIVKQQSHHARLHTTQCDVFLLRLRKVAQEHSLREG